MSLERRTHENARAVSIQFTKPVRAARPDIVFGADLIASFPKGADDMFATILATNRACRLTVQHIFPHSPRPDTPAARMPQLPGKFVMARAARLRQEGRIARDAVLAFETGHRRDVLAELGGTGRTPRFAGLGMQQTPPAGVIVNVIFVGHDGKWLMGAPPVGQHRSLEAAPAGPDIEVRA